jgi:5'(3')-deoxyribonucleotidase
MRIYIDMDDTLCDFSGASADAKLKNPTQKYPQSQWGFFCDLKPLLGAVESVARLRELGHDVWILTRPSVKNLNCYSEKAYWVQKYLGEDMVEKLILACDKSLLKGDVLIDDHDGFGQKEFEGEWIQFGTGNFTSWDDVMSYISVGSEI